MIRARNRIAPTDAALGKAVVTNKTVPSNIREGLNVESGLNDGIVAPLITVAIALGLHPGGVDPSRPQYVGGTTLEVYIGGPTPEARRFAELLDERPELAGSMTELFDRLEEVIEGNVVDDGACIYPSNNGPPVTVRIDQLTAPRACHWQKTSGSPPRTARPAPESV